jgi:tetratricopeptide (TPR) repeat protein
VSFFQFPFGVLFPLGLVGIFLVFKNWSSGNDRTKHQNIILILLFISTYAVSFIVFFVCARYRMPVIPFLLIFASSAVVHGIQEVKRKRFRDLVVPLYIFAGGYIFFNANIFGIKQINPGLNWCTLGDAYKEAGTIEKAVDCYKRSIETDPDHADAYYDLGNIYAQGKQFAVAKDLYIKAITLDPAAARAYSNLGNVYFETDKFDSALFMYAKAIELEPDYETPYCHAGLVNQELGEFAKAESLWLECLRNIPQSTRARELLQRLQKARTEDARNQETKTVKRKE